MASALEPRQYRSRKQKPCDLCRKRRICCIREPGSDRCSLCRTRDIDCTYVSPPPVRRITAQERIRRPQIRNTRSFPATGPPTAQRAGAHGEKSQYTLQYVGLSGDQDPYLLQHSSWDNVKRQGNIAWACKRVNNDPDMPAQFTIVPDQHLDARPTYYPKNNVEETARPHKESLIKAYFDTVHTSFPILSRTGFDPDSASTMLLASMYALSHVFCPEARHIDPWIFLDFLGRAIPLEARNTKLDSIEAALLYSQRHTYIFRAPTMPGLTAEIGNVGPLSCLRHDHRLTAFKLVGMSHDVGLNVDPTNWRISECEKKRRIRLWWAVHMQDKWVALTLGRPSYLHDDQNNVPMVTITDFDDGDDQWSQSALPPFQNLHGVSKRMFVAMAELSVLLSDILSTFYTVKAIHTLKERSSQEMESVINSFTSRLEQWYSVYDTLLQGDKRLLPDPTGTLQLAYYTVQIALCRAILRDRNSHIIRERGEMMVMNVLELLRTIQVYRLRAFWWAISKVNFAIAGAFMFSMLLTSVEDDEVDSWVARIDEYLNLLQAHSISFDVTKLASIRLELLRKVGRLTEDHATNDASSDGASEPAVSSPDVGRSYGQIEGEIGNQLDPLNGQRLMTLDPFGDSENLNWVALMDLE